MDSKVIIGTFPVIDLVPKGVTGNFVCPGPPQLQARPCGVPLGCSSARQNEDFCSEFSAKIVHASALWLMLKGEGIIIQKGHFYGFY